MTIVNRGPILTAQHVPPPPQPPDTTARSEIIAAILCMLAGAIIATFAPLLIIPAVCIVIYLSPREGQEPPSPEPAPVPTRDTSLRVEGVRRQKPPFVVES